MQSPPRLTVRAAWSRSAYMKRYDPAYRRALDFLPSRIEDVKLISVSQRPRSGALVRPSAHDLPRYSGRPAKQARMNSNQRREAAGLALADVPGPGPWAAGSSVLSMTSPYVHGMLALSSANAAEAEHARCSPWPGALWPSACRAAGASA